jgi:hypothetical protein
MFYRSHNPKKLNKKNILFVDLSSWMKLGILSLKNFFIPNTLLSWLTNPTCIQKSLEGSIIVKLPLSAHPIQ